MGTLQRFASHARRVAAAGLFVAVAASAIVACDTPVYRYAMYRWFPAPYEIYYFYEGEMDEAGEKMKAAVEEISEAEEARANVVFLPVDLQKDKELTGVPPDVKDAWQKQQSPTIPSYLVSSPVGAHLRLGSLSVDELPSMIDSPLRQQLGDLLGAGNAGVYIFLESEDAAKNEEKFKVLQSVVEDVGAGKIELYSLPPMRPYGMDPAAEPEEEDNPYKLNVGLLKLARDNEKEKGLVDCLLAVEPDLRESKEPIVFMVYGRGRVLFSCLGEGIHRDNLIQDIEFVTGACSCTVKEQNPGVDMLMRYHWDAAAEKLSREYGAEEGSAYEFGGDALFPELIIPPESDSAATETTEQQEDAGDLEEDAQEVVVAQTDSTAAGDQPGAMGSLKETASDKADSSEPGSAKAASEDDQPGTEVALNASLPPTGSRDDVASDADDGSLASIAWVGAGLLGALIILFGATFLVLRPK